MARAVILLPAYGRRYKSNYEALADWHDGKDFKILGGPYCSIRDFEDLKTIADRVLLLWFDEKLDKHFVGLYNSLESQFIPTTYI